ncbi:glycosyl hydrolase [Weizmannia sp. CD-2023]|uniref:glycosyl hydrolase n=1 Tax=Heyndrickxia TaxID=2837504 RepID=UPI002E205A71|nr:glycosyl hydrolase [Weizmannia sp. CD-2023]MED4841401.1 glycosyl hydrolase [Weizmannia sp. CD-2023]MED4900974.1 glycosyl hydrolase [Weizmannia sp. CD-2023]
MKKTKFWSSYFIFFLFLVVLILLTNCTHSAFELSNQNASKETERLYNYIKNQQGRSIISGQQDLSNAEWIKQMTGNYPAIVGFDFYDYSSASKLAHGGKSYQVEQAIQWHNKNGIVTFCWHWVAPNMKYNENWSNGFYTRYTDFNVEYALDHPKSNDYKMIIKDIDLIAVQLKRLQKANVPILFRPLHEAEGKWFWWGAKGPKYAKKLYILLYNRLTHYHKLNNIIWVWSSTSKQWYPGDKYVDIIGYDYYTKPMDTDPVLSKYKQLSEFNKPVALTETGTIPDPLLVNKTNASWSWFMEWRDDFLKDGSYNKLEYLKYVYNNSYVITLERLPKLK